MSVDPLAQGVDDLYGAPLDEFVARRDALVRELKTAGDPAAADAVKAMAKPSVAAWTVNQLAREQPDDMAELIAAGAELRSVQEWLLRREADPHDLRRAVEAERAVVGRLAGAAADILQAAGRRVGPQLLERIAETLHAAATNAETGERALAGRLVREEVAVGLGGGGGMYLPEMPSRPGRAVADDDEPEPPEPEPDDSERRAAIAAGEARAREAADREREAQRAVGRAQNAMVSREEDLARADRALREAREQLATAEHAAAAARAEAEAAAAELDELRGGQG